MTKDSVTSVSLLGRVCRDLSDKEAWTEFVRRYGPKIYGWCRAWGLQEADAEDVTQTVLLKLVEKLRTFSYDPAHSFRAWLKTLTHHALSDYLEAFQRPGRGSGDSDVGRLLDTVAAREDLAQQLEQEYDRELLEAAMVRVRLRVSSQRWEAFRLTAVEGLSGAEAARQLNMKVATVFTAKSKVKKLVHEELRKLEGPASG
ncbi:MAG: sigma-70 family RNA polymerase sigma factor [Planctomycetes bacterium]|nr:sigma-70 family RNA polymerase sigma factor [Planctomycetota bacterium]